MLALDAPNFEGVLATLVNDRIDARSLHDFTRFMRISAMTSLQ